MVCSQAAHVLELVVVAFGLARLGAAILNLGVVFGELVFRTEVASTGLLAVEGIMAEDFGEFEEVSGRALLFSSSAFSPLGDPGMRTLVQNSFRISGMRRRAS